MVLKKIKVSKNNKNNKKWYNQDLFLSKLKIVEEYLINKNKIKKNNDLIIFTFNKVQWDSLLYPYIYDYNYKPNEEFIDFIFRFTLSKSKNNQDKDQENKIIKLNGIEFKQNNLKYIKLEKNQIKILDALFYHGSGTKKYNFEDKKIFSEHSGSLDFNNDGLEKVIVNAQFTLDKNDPELFFPENLIDAYDYEYLFHTHPLTPAIGSRIKDDILYEFPSISDIFHFIENFNNGNIQGSIIIAPEGLYNIRKIKFNKIKLIIDQKKLYRILNKYYWTIQEKAIQKHKKNIKNNFFTIIAQDDSFIKELNDILKEFKLIIDYFPRIKDKNEWIIDTIYLPVFITEINS